MSDPDECPPMPPKRGPGRPRKDPNVPRAPRKKKPHQRTDPAAIRRWERDWECVKMRRQDIDWPTIVETLGYSSIGHAHDRCAAFMRNYPREDAETLRDMEMMRLDEAAKALRPRIEDGDPRAVEVYVKVSERRSKLGGLDAPERKQLTVITEDVVNQQIMQARAELAQKMQSALEAGVPLPELPSAVIEGELA